MSYCRIFLVKNLGMVFLTKGLFCGINRPQDPESLSEMEKKHVPVLDVPGKVSAGEPFKVTISVGSIPHVMDKEHHIQWIDLYSGGNFLTKIVLTPVFTRAEVTVSLVKSGGHKTATLRAVERCNIHGMWEASREIVVE